MTEGRERERGKVAGPHEAMQSESAACTRAVYGRVVCSYPYKGCKAALAVSRTNTPDSLHTTCRDHVSGIRRDASCAVPYAVPCLIGRRRLSRYCWNTSKNKREPATKRDEGLGVFWPGLACEAAGTATGRAKQPRRGGGGGGCRKPDSSATEEASRLDGRDTSCRASRRRSSRAPLKAY